MLLHMMREIGMTCNVINFNAAMPACGNGGQWQLWRREVLLLNVISSNARVVSGNFCV